MTRTFRILALATAGAMLAGCSGGVQESLGLKKKAPDEFSVVRNAPLSLPPNFSLRPPKQGAVGEGREPQRDQARALLVSRSATSQNSSQLAAARAQAELANSTPASAPVQFAFHPGRIDQALGDLREYRLNGASNGEVIQASARTGAPQVARAPDTAPGESALLANLGAANVNPNIRRQVDEESALLAEDDRNIVEQMMFWRKLNPPGVIVEAKGERRRINENSALGKPVTDGETPEIRVERLSEFKGFNLF
jgi:hypothetical protein